jgi:hypothetical protein
MIWSIRLSSFLFFSYLSFVWASLFGGPLDPEHLALPRLDFFSKCWWLQFLSAFSLLFNFFCVQGNAVDAFSQSEAVMLDWYWMGMGGRHTQVWGSFLISGYDVCMHLMGGGCAAACCAPRHIFGSSSIQSLLHPPHVSMYHTMSVFYGVPIYANILRAAVSNILWAVCEPTTKKKKKKWAIVVVLAMD